MPYTQLASDLSAGKLPAFSFITPNLIDDMHDGTVAQGDTVAGRQPAHDPEQPRVHQRLDGGVHHLGRGRRRHRDEKCATNKTDVGCHVATIVISPSTKPGTRSATLFNHYSLLGTAEQLLGLPALGKAASFPTMTSAFNL